MILSKYFFSTLVIALAMLLYILIKGVVIHFFDLGLKLPRRSLIDSLYYSVISFLTAGYGNLSPESRRGKITLMITGMIGIVLMGLFVSSSYSSFQDYSQYQERKSGDEKVLRIMGEIRQDYINLMSNYALGKFAFEQKLSFAGLKEQQDNVYEALIRSNVPDLGGEYHEDGLKAFLSSAEIINKKIHDLLLLNFNTNYPSEIKYVAFLSRNLVNDFHWNFFKRSKLQMQNRDFVNSTLIVGNDKNLALVGRLLNVEHELGLLNRRI